MSAQLPSEPTSCNDSVGTVLERSYRETPVVEALCEIYFADSTWDDTVPGTFYEKIKDEFPVKRRCEAREAQVAPGRGTVPYGAHTLSPWMQFISEENNLMIQVAENLLVINQLRPYRHFEDWEQVVYRALGNYGEAAAPRKVARIGIRYVNQIEIPGEKISMEEYFAIYPQLPKSLGDARGSFLVRVEVPKTGQNHTVLITFGTPVPVQPTEEKQVFTLDLYDIARLGIPVRESELKKEIRRAHDNVVMAFEDSITDRLRALLGVEAQK